MAVLRKSFWIKGFGPFLFSFTRVKNMAVNEEEYRKERCDGIRTVIPKNLRERRDAMD